MENNAVNIDSLIMVTRSFIDQTVLMNNIRHINYKLGKHKTCWRCRLTDDGDVALLHGVGSSMITRIIADSDSTRECIAQLQAEFAKPEWSHCNVMVL